jgi:hypothetical protein
MKPNKERSRRLVVILWVFTAFAVIASISDLMEYFLLKKAITGSITLAEETSNDRRQLIVGIISLALTVLVAVFFIQWFRRAYYNLHQLFNNLRFNEGWAAGAWFVPFMNLGRPYRIMKEMMFVAESALSKANFISEKKARKRLVGIWWTLWLIVTILSDSTNRVRMRSENLDILTNTTLLDAFLRLLYIPLTLVTVKMIKHYAELEEHLPSLGLSSDRPFRMDDSDLLDTI